jgi:two-component system NtrC family sensor kinase
MLRELQATQRTLISGGLLGILIATLLVSFLVRNVTQPLRDLRDGAEAVGRGDFTHRVKVTSRDECGELANVFNQMTENLQVSHSELEETVARLKNTQAQLVQSEKLSAIGEFVAGVTHELNNPLTSLLGFSELLQQTKVDERQKRFVDRITASARRCQKIVQSLLSFARQHAPERKSTNLNELVETVIEILAYEMRTSNIELVKQLDPALPGVLVDPHQIQQVFLNLLNNARQAMEGHQASGRLRVRTEAAHDRVRVTFQDNGPGISEENLKKIFDPFFTTKEAGKGTGLGLSLSYGIVQEHGGTIRAESKPGTGATFVIELPAHVGATATPKDDGKDTRANAAPQGAGKRVLVIDDEEAILDFVAEVLSADGFQVDTARDGDAALRQLRRQRYDLALCDWKMPGLNGQRLFERVQSDDPATARRFVFMTGDVINRQAEAFLKEHGKVCLPKPFSIADFRFALSGLAEHRN